MAARPGLETNIQLVRGLACAGTSDYTFGTVPYWSDDHLTTILDLNRFDVEFEPLQPVPRLEDGTAVYMEYRSRYGNLESGTAVFRLQTSAGSVVPLADYSVDYTKGIVTFAADQRGTAYFMTGRAYDLNGAAADVWTHKAAYYTTAVNFSTDNQSVQLGAVIDNCLKMADHYNGLRQTTTIPFERDDTLSGEEA